MGTLGWLVCALLWMWRIFLWDFDSKYRESIDFGCSSRSFNVWIIFFIVDLIFSASFLPVTCDIHFTHDNSSLCFREAYAKKQKMWNMKNFSFVFIKLWNETWNSNFTIVLWFEHIESSAKSFSFLFYDCSSRFLLWQKSHHWKLKWNCEFSAS